LKGVKLYFFNLFISSFINSSGVSKTIGSNSYIFDKIVSGYNADKINIYEKIQYLLRQNLDIDVLIWQ
jgi:hypothetical protein